MGLVMRSLGFGHGRCGQCFRAANYTSSFDATTRRPDATRASATPASATMWDHLAGYTTAGPYKESIRRQRGLNERTNATISVAVNDTGFFEVSECTFQKILDTRSHPGEAE